MIPYFDHPFSQDDLNDNPIAQFQRWYQEIQKNEELEPGAMALATVDRNFQIKNRMVLLKDVTEKGFTFFTHYTSPKAQDLDTVSQAALVFWWPKSQRQVRITGKISKTSEAESDQYFNTRGRDKQIAAVASAQSQMIPNRDFLLKEVARLESQYGKDSPIPRPKTWGGYLVTPDSLEFWQGRVHRLHDRFVYTRNGTQWDIQQLAP